jgi:N-acetylglucosamine malate deacetylase 1
MDDAFDLLAIGAHPDDMEAVMAGTAAKLADRGLRVLFVDLCSGEPARHAAAGARGAQARRAAELLGVERVTLGFQDRLIRDDVATRLAVADLLRRHRPRTVVTTDGCGVHPDHKAVTDAVVHGVFYARLPKWGEVPGGEALANTAPHEVERLFFGHCRMEPPWPRFDFAVDVSEVYERKLAALAAYESVFSGAQAELLDRYGAEDRYVGALVGVRYAEAFRARSPLLVDDPTVFARVRFG